MLIHLRCIGNLSGVCDQQKLGTVHLIRKLIGNRLDARLSLVVTSFQVRDVTFVVPLRWQSERLDLVELLGDQLVLLHVNLGGGVTPSQRYRPTM